MDFRVLGPLEVWDGDRLIPVHRHKHRALLALLVLHAGEVMSVDRLIDAVWGERPPATAREALHNYVSQLRRVLGAGVLETREGGYVLNAGPDEIDAARFDRLVAQAYETSAPAQQVAILERALALWRGRPLADLTYESSVATDADRLEAARMAAEDALVDAKLELGRHAELVPELEARAAEDPLKERRWRQLMLALYRSGRQAEALEAYRQAHRRLIDFGLDPSPGLRSLEQSILNQDPALDLATALPPVEERRKTVTVMFCELALTTADVDPERLHGLTARALADARAAIEQYGGAVEVRAGDELLGVFGVPGAHEDDALRAVRAADELRRIHGTVAFRIGIDTGEVLVGHGFVSGDVVSTGKRLERTAASGEVRIGAATRALCGPAITVDEVGGSLRLLQVQVGREPLAPAVDTRLVNRLRELEALRQAYARAHEECRGRLVTVTGEPGVGKTRVVREFVAGLRDEATVLIGRCTAYGQGSASLPLREMMVEAGSRFETVVPVGASAGEQVLAVRRFFEDLARVRPLAVVFEDAHWAEAGVLDLMEQLDGRVEGPILTLCVARPELGDQRPSLTAGALELAPLTANDVETLVTALGSGAPDGVRRHAVQASGGNPLFVQQLLAYGAEGGDVDALPPSLDALIAARLDLLDPAERALLGRASVVGRVFSRAAVQHVTPRDKLGQFAGALQSLAGRRLIRRARGGLRFQHGLVRDAAYAAVPMLERAELHEQLADWLEGRGEPSELVGSHLERAYKCRVGVEGLDGRASRIGTAAGQRLGAAGIESWKRGDVVATVSLLSRATALLSSLDPERRELLCELGHARRTAGDWSGAMEALTDAAEDARAAGDRRLELRARLALAYFRLYADAAGPGDDVLALADEAIPLFEALHDDWSLARAWRFVADVRGPIGGAYREAVAAAERALTYYHAAGWPPSACVADLAAILYYGPTPVHEGIERCRALLEEADLNGQATLLVFLGGFEAMLGEFDAGRRRVARAKDLYEQLGQAAAVVANCGAVSAQIELLAREYATAQEVLEATCAELEAMGDLASLATRLAELADVLLRRGHDDEAEIVCRRAEALGAHDLVTQVIAKGTRARLLARRGDLEGAVALGDVAVGFAQGSDALNRLARAQLDQSEVLRAAGRAHESGVLVERAMATYELKGNVAAVAAFDR
jgi:DNA-binding SARP family transcriptional activator